MPILLFLFLFISSCGGGGGGGGGGGAPVTSGGGGGSGGTTADWTVTSSEADIYRTEEYDNQYGLEQIKAAQAYATLNKNGKEVAGDSVTIAVLDTGAQTDHNEISANYNASESYDYVNSDSDPSDDNGHGTHVASTAAGVKGNGSMHGVAYESTIIVQKVLNSSGNGSYSNLSLAFADSVDAGAKVINMSLGSSGGNSSFKTTMINEKSNDVLTAAATGNQLSSESVLQPNYPARYASDSDLQGYIIAVAAVDSSSNIASFSYHCGDAMNYCLVAPGVDIYAAIPTSTYTTFDGTSMATPHVAGAAAVIRAAWPHLTAPQTTQILLQTATDLGATGVDSIYGHGLLNLYAAVQAQGQNTLGYGSTVSSGGYELGSSSLSGSAIFGDAFTTNIAPKLSAAIFFDDFGRDYKANLASKITERNSSYLMGNFNSLFYNNIVTETLPLSFGEGLRNKIKFNFSHYKNSEAPNYYGLKFATIDRSVDPQKNLTQGFSFNHNAAEISPDLNFGFAYNFDEIAAGEAKEFGNFGFISQNNFAANPYQSFLQSGFGNEQTSRKFNQFFASHNLMDKKLALKFSYQSSYDNSQISSGFSSKQNQILDFGLSIKTPKNGSKILLSFGNLTEFDNNLLNAKSLGAFESKGAVKTNYAKFSVNQTLLKNLQLIASFSEGISKINGNAEGVFRAFENVRSRSTSIALVHDNFLKGRIGLIYYQPLRVYRGNVQFDIPVARDLQGNLTRYHGSASLAPQGKERDLEFFYLRDLSDSAQMKFNFVRQVEAGNIKNAATNYIGFMSFVKKI